MKFIKLFINSSIFFGLLFLLASCNEQKRISKTFNYFQKGLDSNNVAELIEPKFKENDLISIQVIAGSLKQEDATLFNLANGGNTNSSSQSGAGQSNSSQSGYLVDVNGFIEMPKIGKIKAAGFSKTELAAIITNRLENEVKNPLVVVRYQQFKINVLGEAKRTGVITFRSDKVTILDAIAEVGDLTETANREDILVMRKNGDKWDTYKINLISLNIFKSPAYQVFNNDIIYIGANINKLKAVNVNPNIQRDITIATAIVSMALVLVNTFFLFKR
jgi:polysaccharide biosynthesis/export protein